MFAAFQIALKSLDLPRFSPLPGSRFILIRCSAYKLLSHICSLLIPHRSSISSPYTLDLSSLCLTCISNIGLHICVLHSLRAVDVGYWEEKEATFCKDYLLFRDAQLFKNGKGGTRNSPTEGLGLPTRGLKSLKRQFSVHRFAKFPSTGSQDFLLQGGG